MSFVISKTRLAPIKTLTIPRLELQAAVAAARMKTKILAEIDFEVDETHFWSDSKIVLHYLRDTQRRFTVYVSHRVAEIASKSDNVDRPFYDCSRMGEVLHLEKAYWALHTVDQVQVQPDEQGKESGSTSRAADQEFDC